MSSEQFYATLPVTAIAARFAARVARYRVSENDRQAVFSGGGIAWADGVMKIPATGAQYAIAPAGICISSTVPKAASSWRPGRSRRVPASIPAAPAYSGRAADTHDPDAAGYAAGLICVKMEAPGLGNDERLSCGRCGRVSESTISRAEHSHVLATCCVPAP